MENKHNVRFIGEDGSEVEADCLTMADAKLRSMYLADIRNRLVSCEDGEATGGHRDTYFIAHPGGVVEVPRF